MATIPLEKKIRNYAYDLHRRKKFPAFVSGAEYKNYKKTASSGDIKNSDFVQDLRNSLIIFGTIGSKYNGSSIGYCAETVSANRILKRFPNKLTSLNVGQAIRPKTLQVGKKCKICKTIF
jgi:hypothetical protein